MAKYTEGFLSHTTNSRLPENRGTSGSKRKPAGGVNAIQKDPPAPARLSQPERRRTPDMNLNDTRYNLRNLSTEDLIASVDDGGQYYNLLSTTESSSPRRLGTEGQRRSTAGDRRRSQERRLGK